MEISETVLVSQRRWHAWTLSDSHERSCEVFPGSLKLTQAGGERLVSGSWGVTLKVMRKAGGGVERKAQSGQTGLEL